MDLERDVSLYNAAYEFVQGAAADAMGHTRTNPNPQAQNLATTAARNGFRAGVREMLEALEYFIDDDGIETPNDLYEALKQVGNEYLTHTEMGADDSNI